eukprot:787098_1
MSVERLNINDVIIFKTNREYIGVIKYIGLIYGLHEMTQYVGIELLESIGQLGHQGDINGYSYFSTKQGYGTHCRLTHVIRKLAAFEIFGLFQRKLIQKNKQIKELESIVDNNQSNCYSPFKIRCGKNALIFDNDISTMSKQTDVTFASNISVQTPLSRISLTPKSISNSSANKTMISKPTLSLAQSESIISYAKSEYESFPETSPVPEPVPIQPPMFLPKSETTPVQVHKRKKHKKLKKKHNKKKKKNKRRKKSFSQSMEFSESDTHSMEPIPVIRDYPHSAPNSPNVCPNNHKNYMNNHKIIKQMNPIRLDQWVDNSHNINGMNHINNINNINHINNINGMRSYEQFLADPIPISPVQPLQPLQPVQPRQANKFLFLGYR